MYHPKINWKPLTFWFLSKKNNELGTHITFYMKFQCRCSKTCHRILFVQEEWMYNTIKHPHSLNTWLMSNFLLWRNSKVVRVTVLAMFTIANSVIYVCLHCHHTNHVYMQVMIDKLLIDWIITSFFIHLYSDKQVEQG